VPIIKDHTVRAKVNRKTADVARPVSSAGKDAVSIYPPKYGIDFLDSEMSMTAAVSGRAAAIQPKQATGLGRQVLNANAARPEITSDLPSNLKAGIEHLSGMALDDVKVHYNSSKPSRLQAIAFAQGTNIYLAPGQEKHLPHEAWHVVQQRQGRVKPTAQINGVAINANSGLENEANIMGAKAHGTIVSNPGLVSEALPGAPPSGRDGSIQGSQSAGMKASDTRPMTGKAESTEGPVAQRFIGLELEFPIPVDNGKRGDIDKDKIVLNAKNGFKVVVDHSSGVSKLSEKDPPQAMSSSILEFVFEPPVEELKEVRSVLENIYAKVREISANTAGLTKRVLLNKPYYVGPINAGNKTPAGLGTHAHNLQVNIGVHTGSIAEFMGGFAGASQLEGEDPARGWLREARTAASILVQTVREEEGKEEARLEGLEGLFAIIALYLYAGSAGQTVRGGTVKNFTPLLLKTPISTPPLPGREISEGLGLVEKTLTKDEQELWKENDKRYLGGLLNYVRGEQADKQAKVPEKEFLVQNPKGEKKGTKVSDLLSTEFKAPFVPGTKAIAAEKIREGVPTKGAVFETRYGTGDFSLDQAYQRAKEVFEIAEKANLPVAFRASLRD
jgi:hypothetical protein